MPPAIPDKLPCESVQQLEEELSTLRDALSLEETEDTWDRIARALTRMSAVIKGGGYKYEKELVNGIKASARAIVSAMNSERTRLSAAALDCLTITAPRVGLAFEALVPLFVPHILRLATRTNKVYVTRSQTSLALILGYCHIPSIIPYLLAACKESKIITGRAVAVEGVLRCLNKWDWTDKDIKARVGDVEEVIKVTGRDKDAGIRQTSRQVFEAYKVLFPERVDEFTGPLTPVMRKYLDIKPHTLISKAIENARPPAQKMPKQPVAKPLFASSTSAISSTSGRAAFRTHGRSATSTAVVATDIMPPPASIPSRGRSTSRQQIQRPNPDNHQSGRHDDHERQRVLSTASSTFSVKSAPPDSHSGYDHRPPVRLATSQSPDTMTNAVIAASSGQARRVRRNVAVEPHPANQRDFSTVSHKAPVRATPVAAAAVSLSQMQNPTQGPGESASPAQSAPGAGTGVVFPTIKPESAPVVRKGAQRVPKPAPPLRVSPPPKADRPETAMSDGVKREIKPSIFRRGAPNVPTAGEKKKREKVTEGFAPRRGGGVTQPTLSQLSKQKTLPSANEIRLVSGKTASTSVVSKRPVWGAGSRLTASKASQAPRVFSRNGVTKASSAKHNDQAKVTETQSDVASIPIPETPDGERDDVPLVVPLSGSPTVLRVNEEQTQEVTVLDEEITEQAPTVAQDSMGSETNSEENQIDKAREIAEDPSDKGSPHTFVTETNAAPRTPPYPSGDEESDEDELDAIEFTTGDVYNSAGVPIKTPGKVVTDATRGVPQERNPLAEVVFNE